MNQDKQNFYRRLFFIPMAIAVFIVADTFLFPKNTQQETITDIFENRKRKNRSFHIETDKQQYNIPEKLFNAVNRGNVITVYRSALTKRPLKVFVDHKDWSYYYNIGFANAGIGVVYVGFIFFTAFFLYIYYYKIPSRNGRMRGMFAVVIIGFVLLFSYLDWDPGIF